jgi:hypothetical protein
MLRQRQTHALGDKIARMFENFTPKTSFQTQTVLATVHQSFNGDRFTNAAPLAASRRRRLRRARSGGGVNSIRASWF